MQQKETNFCCFFFSSMFQGTNGPRPTYTGANNGSVSNAGSGGNAGSVSQSYIFFNRNIFLNYTIN